MSDRSAITPVEPTPPVTLGNVTPAPNMLGTIAQLIQHLQPPASPVDPIAHIRALEDAYQHNWILGTSELAQLLKIAPKTLVRHGSMERYGFICERSGQNGTELGWRFANPRPRARRNRSSRESDPYPSVLAALRRTAAI
ncbi:MAG: hypothetical protein AAGM36_01020 [Cyanobacteria bacterium J06597_1]